ncbi:hypothetical protein MSAN_01832900 [Mycena sanguinolenta]|uniref:Uncharacterized protein n=1 Tax=Mycena sanguinolenta TaxID=230812 RepID=A0A8H6XQD7_9AGAR|nr:hypothetical protein MSAN_01832900 [Mycena sanguinolenta]
MRLLKIPTLPSGKSFKKFIVYPRVSPVATKTSIDKTLDDAAQDKAPQGPATGAHKALLDNGGSSDPPPQYKLLGGASANKKADAAKSEVSNSDDEEMSPLPTTSSEDEDDEGVSNKDGDDHKGKHSNNGPKVNSAAPEADVLPIVVHFIGSESREVWIPPSKIPVAKASDDSGEYVAPLREILPFALAQDSPIKKDGKAKLGIVGPLGSHLNLGTVDDFAGDSFPAPLSLDSINNYKLKQSAPPGLIFKSIASQGLEGPKDKPLEVARQRAVAKTALEDEGTAQGSPIARVLREELGGPTNKRPPAFKIDKMRARYREYTDAIEVVTRKYADGANFRFPADHPSDLKGFLFKTEDVQNAMRLGHTTINNDSKFFRPTRLRDDHSGKAEAYFENNLHREIFDKMAVKEWNKYLDDAKAEKEALDRAEAREEERKRKRREEKEQKKQEREERKHKKHKRDGAEAGSSRQRMTSENLDSENS